MALKQHKPLTPENKDLHLIIVLDESGSMTSVWDTTISSINELIQSQHIDDGKTWVTLVKFNTISTPLVIRQDISEWVPLTRTTYYPDGWTALLDAVWDAIHDSTEHAGEKTMVVIMTDGEENASRNHTRDQIKALVKDKQGEGWEFTFLGANIDAYTASQQIGVTTAASYQASNAGTRGTTRTLSAYLSNYRVTGQAMASASLQDMVDEETELANMQEDDGD
jgi:hypothetical protein